MSGAIIYTPSTGSDWATAWEQAEYTRKGKFGLSLTNYNTTSLPAIASGSWCEVAGSIYKWTIEEAISGSLSSSAVNYIKLVPSGSGDTAIVTATWTTSAPTWSDAYQGWYDGTSRYIGGCYYDATGPTYYAKWVWTEPRADFLQDRYTANLRYGIKTIHWSAWNMNSTATLGVTFELGSTIAGIEPLFVTARIHDSDVAYYYPVPYFVGGTIDAWIQGWNSSGCTLERRTSGFFDSVDYETALGDVTVIYPLKVI